MQFETTKSSRSEEDISHLEAERYESLGDEIVRQNSVIIRQDGEIISLKADITRQDGEITSLKVDNTSLKVEIARQGGDILSLKGAITVLTDFRSANSNGCRQRSDWSEFPSVPPKAILREDI